MTGSTLPRFTEPSPQTATRHAATSAPTITVPPVTDHVGTAGSRHMACTTPDCPGDGRYAPPGRGHRDGCHYPFPAAPAAPPWADAPLADATLPPPGHVRLTGITAPSRYDTWTHDALAGLVGQTPRLLIDGDWARPVGACRIVFARTRLTTVMIGGDPWHRGASIGLELTFDTPLAEFMAAAMPVAHDGSPTPIGIGFTIGKATHHANLDRRALRDVTVRTLWADTSQIGPRP